MTDEGGIWMSKKGSVGFEIITDYMAGKFTRPEAAEMLEVRERTITRMAARVRKKGLAGMVHAKAHNHCNYERHLISREIYKRRRSAALTEWRAVMVKARSGLGFARLPGAGCR